MLRSIATKPFLSDFGILILRVVTGTLLIHHGYEKLANIENFADAFAILAVGPGLFAIDELIVRRFSPELEREQSGSIDTVLSDGGVA